MKIPIFPGKYHQNGGFSMAMLVYRRVCVIKSKASPPNTITQQRIQDSCSLGSDCPSALVGNREGSRRFQRSQVPPLVNKTSRRFCFEISFFFWFCSRKDTKSTPKRNVFFLNAVVKNHPQSNKPQGFCEKYNRISPCHFFVDFGHRHI